MLLLSSTHATTLTKWSSSGVIGGLITPNHKFTGHCYARLGLKWGMDNGCFHGLNPKAFAKMLEKNADAPGCLWAVVPDVFEGKVTDAAKTLNQFRIWRDNVAEYGYKIALVAQIGLTREAMLPFWSKVDCIFIGGDNAYKLGKEAELLTREAKERGKWVHVGRVNSFRRLNLVASWGVDSVDGKSTSQYANRDMPRLASVAQFWSLERGKRID